MNRIEAIIYDMDGVLIDSEPLWQEAEKIVFAHVGLKLSTQDCLKTKGMRIDEVVGYWYETHPWNGPSQQAIIDAILVRLIDLIQSKGKRMPGVLESIHYFKENNLPLAIATSSPVRVMQAILSKLKIAHYFDVLCSAEFEEYGKPHPAVYLTTARKLNVSPRSCLVIEDSFSGMQSAKAANMRVIVIPETSEHNTVDWSQSDYKLISLNEVSDLNLL